MIIGQILGKTSILPQLKCFVLKQYKFRKIANYMLYFNLIFTLINKLYLLIRILSLILLSNSFFLMHYMAYFDVQQVVAISSRRFLLIYKSAYFFLKFLSYIPKLK